MHPCKHPHPSQNAYLVYAVGEDLRLEPADLLLGATQDPHTQVQRLKPAGQINKKWMCLRDRSVPHFLQREGLGMLLRRCCQACQRAFTQAQIVHMLIRSRPNVTELRNSGVL